MDSDSHDARHHQSDDARQLRRTRDYRALTAVVQELRRQREQALHDIARLALLRERALAAPAPFVLRLKRDRACLDDSSRSHDGNSDANAAAQGDRGDDDVNSAERPQHDAEEESYADDPAAGPMLPLPRRQFVARLPRVDLHRYAYATRPRGEKEATRDQGREMIERAASTNAPIPHHDAGGGGGDQMDEVLDGGQVPNAGTGTTRDIDSSAAAAGLQRIKQEEAERPTGHGEGRRHHHGDDVHVAPVAAAVKREGGVKEEFPPGEGNLPREEPKAGDVIRGRVWDEDKPSTFNKLWTPDEQRRLELLLLEIPDEEVAAHRWSKIARALGNRTPRQVASRVQKHFIKLARAGLPVPGKPPNLDACLRKRRKTAHQQPTHSGVGSGPEGAAAYYTLPPVQMPDDDDEEDDDEEEEVEEEVGADNGEAKGTLSAQPAASLALGKGEGQQQQPYDDEDYRMYRAQAPNYLDPAFMPS